MTSSSSEVLLFPKSFLKELDQKNSEKTKTAPLALFLAAHYDHFYGSDRTGMLALPSNRFLLLEIATTHRVVVSSIKEASDIHKSIQRTAKIFRQKINLLIFLSHGSPSFLALDELRREKNLLYQSLIRGF